MRKVSLLLILFLLITKIIFAQSAYYDAFKIKYFLVDDGEGNLKLNANKLEEWTAILIPYDSYLLNQDSSSIDVILKKFNDNPFIKRYLPEGITRSTVTVSPPAAKDFLSTVGGLNISTIADGLTKFLVKRTKEELNTAFFIKFKEDLDSPEYADLKILFPESYKVLRVIETQVYNFSPYLLMLKEAFKKDLSSIIENLINIINSNRHEEFFSKHSGVKEIFSSALTIIKGLNNSIHPGDIINTIAKNGLTSIDNNLDAGIKILNYFSNSLKSSDPDRYWISSDELSLLNDDAFIIYMGLVYQSMDRNISFSYKTKKINFDEILKTTAQVTGEIKEYKIFINGFINKAEVIEEHLRKTKKDNDTKPDYGDYIKYYNESLDLFDYALDINKFIKIDSVFIGNAEKFVKKTHLLGEIFADINMKQYSSAILNSTLLLDDILDEKIKSGILKYGSFLSIVTQAETSDEVMAAIETIALPPESYRTKRTAQFNIELNAYVGLTGSYEYNKSLDKFYPIGAVYAPVGIAASWGICDSPSINESGSFTIFASLIDIGVVTAYRFTDQNSEELPELKLENIFAPGLSFIYGFPNCPLSIGIGGQLGPALRNITTEAIETANGLNYRIHAFIAVDIPLINFFTNMR